MSRPNPPGNPRSAGSGILARRGPLIAASVAIGLTAIFYATKRPPQPAGTSEGTFGTQGVENIEKAYTNAGATGTHTKAYGGTPMGSKDDENLREHSPAGTGAPKGMKSKPYGDEQRPSDSTKVEKKFQKSNFGDEQGK